MAQRVNLDAMIPREDFEVADEEAFELGLLADFPITHLTSDSPVLRLLRKPDFQRETNHWTPEQVAVFIASFLDNEVIPSLILWKSPTYIFVIDGGHRLSALRAWIHNDYGDGVISREFYNGEISREQRKVAERTRRLVEAKVGRYSNLKDLVGKKLEGDQVSVRRGNRLFTRSLTLQWIQGNASVAETSFFKINSQGTPLDDVEEMLIKNRRKPYAIAARAILRSGTGHEYWSSFGGENKEKIKELALEFHDLLFDPESESPLRTLDIPLGGSTSPVDALALLIDFLTLASSRSAEPALIDQYEDDESGEVTISVMKRSLDVLQRITGNSPGSLGLHPVIYFYNERGKYSRFLFLGMVRLITLRISNNDKGFFQRFVKARRHVEGFLVDHKNVITLVLQNLSKRQRVPKMTELFSHLVSVGSSGDDEDVIREQLEFSRVGERIGLSGRILDMGESEEASRFSDEAKSSIFVRNALPGIPKCPVCQGFLNIRKSVSYDHVIPVRKGGRGSVSNGQLLHPYCNAAVKC